MLTYVPMILSRIEYGTSCGSNKSSGTGKVGDSKAVTCEVFNSFFRFFSLFILTSDNFSIFDKQKSRSARQPPAWSSLTVHMRKLLLFRPANKQGGFFLLIYYVKIS